MKQLDFESAQERIRKAFGRPLIDPAPHVIEITANRSPSRWRAVVGPTVLCAVIGLAAVVGARDTFPPLGAPFNATAPEPAETWSDDTTSLPDHVTGAALDARCEQLWNLLDAQIDIIHEETPKPGFTQAYRSASRLGLLTARQIQSQGCPVKDEATFAAQIASIQALNQMLQ